MEMNVMQHIPHFIEGGKTETFGPLWADYVAQTSDPSDPVRVIHFLNLVEIANALPPGDYIELGTYRGFTLRMIHKLMDPSRTLYALDTFEGFDQRDIDIEKTVYANAWEAGGFAPTSIEMVGSYVGDGKCPDNLKLIKGWFPATYSGLEEKRWRFVHIDFDLYEPIRKALETLWPQILPGGVVMVHDYGCLGFPGAKKAVDEFCSARNVFPVQVADRWGTAVIRKPMDIGIAGRLRSLFGTGG